MTHADENRLVEVRPFPRLQDHRLSSKRHCFVGIFLAAIALIIAELMT